MPSAFYSILFISLMWNCISSAIIIFRRSKTPAAMKSVGVECRDEAFSTIVVVQPSQEVGLVISAHSDDAA